MLLKSVRLGGWRSFAPEYPAEATEFGMVNLLIGPNNVGKSNLGRFLVRLRDILQVYGRGHPWDKEQFHSPLAVPFEAEEIDRWLRADVLIEAEVALVADALKILQPLPSMLVSRDAVRFKICMSSAGGQSTLSIAPLTQDNRLAIIKDGATYKLLLEDGSYTEQVTAAHTYSRLALAACKRLAESIIEIRALRDTARKPARQIERSTDGGDIIGALQVKQNDKNQQGFWTKCKRDLEAWFAVLLGENDVRIEINEAGFWIETKRGESRLRCALPDLGAGVSEILMVLAYLRLHPDEKCLVVIDEPEAHLHPGAVVELARIITTHLSNHQLLVTTHSTALVDAVTPTWRTFRVRRAAHQGTALEMLDTRRTELALLSDLGVRPSQLFLARVALWVEGPSDVHYWTALLREVDRSLVVGRDFTFVVYGGASSSHLDFGDDEDEGDEGADRLVQVLKVSHRVVIICDRDRTAVEDDRALADRLKAAARKLPQHARLEMSTGREIENGVRPEVLLRVLKEVRPQRLNKPDLVRVNYVGYGINEDDAFDEVVAKAARTEDGQPLTAAQVARIKQRLEQNKHKIAARIREIGLTEQVFKDEAVRKAKEMVDWMLADPNGGQWLP
jgi:hypothetical protein